MFLAPLTSLVLLSCIETGLDPDKKDPDPGEETGIDCPPGIPDCHDTEEPVDTSETETEEPDLC